MSWEKVRLADCCRIKPPKSEAKKKLKDSDLVSFVPMNNLGIDTPELLLEEDKALSKVSGSYTYFADNDVLLAKITPCFENGKLGIAKGLTNGIGFGSSEFIVFRTSDRLLPEYLYYYLLRPSFRQTGQSVMTGAVGHKRVPKDFIEDTEIPLPSIPEQKRIVAILDQAFADIDRARALTEKILKNARELFESYLQQVFSQRGEGWVKAELFDHVRFIDYRGKTPTKTESGLRLITAKNVRMGYLRDDPMEYVAPDSYDEWMTRGIPVKGDVLFTTEAPLANVAQLETDEKVVFAQRIITMQPDREVLNDSFLKYLLMSPPIQRRIHEKGTGATATGIKASLLKKIPIEFPGCLEEQAAIVEKLNSLTTHVERLEEIYSEKHEWLTALKKTLLQKAFSGELTCDSEEAAA
ncbi:restriction endonuclease subunit S [Porticoccus sp.]